MSESANESDALLSRARRDTYEKESIITSRFKTILFLVVIVFAGIAYQSEVNQLQLLLETQKEKVDHLEAVLEIHNEVINRFNASVTNSDVVKRLESLETTLQSTQTKLRKELKDVEDKVSAELSDTLESLNATVSRAEREISDEVEKVKKDVEHYVVTTQDQFSMENSFMVYQLAGTFTLLSCLISMWHMTAHIRKLNQPDVQRKILAILWMVPIYAITSWFSLVFHSAEGYLAILKDGYEAYVIYQFLSFCIAVLGKGDRDSVLDLLAKRADHLTPPFRLLGIFEVCGLCKPKQYESSRALASDILLQCQFFAMQFVFFRPLTTTAMVVLKKMDYYGAGDGPTDYRAPQFYITIIQNISIFTAFTGLLKFYHAVDKDLAWCRPFAKFLCIKCVVFMTFWQGLAISILASTTDVGGQDANEWAQSAQNFLICLEMLLFSIAHFYCFPTDEWEEGYRVKHSDGKFGDSIALRDFFSDVKLILRANVQSDKNKKNAKRPTIPEGDEEESSHGSGHTDSPSTDGTEVGSIVASEGNGYHTTTTEHRSLQSEEQQLALALEECLGLAADDPDIAEAKERLLKSNFLSPDMFLDTATPDDTDAIDRQIGAYLGENLDVFENEYEATPNGGIDEEMGDTDYDPHGGIYSNVKYIEGEDAVGESTKLLASPDYKLRPSIFTAVASIADTESDSDRKDAEQASKPRSA